MNDPILDFLDKKINVQSAKKATLIDIKPTKTVVDDITVMAFCELTYPYPKLDHTPSSLEFGVKNGEYFVKVSGVYPTRIYFINRLDDLKRLTNHLIALCKYYKQTSWFLRSRFLPAVFLKIKEMVSPVEPQLSDSFLMA